MKHSPQYLSAGRWGHWVQCSCGWVSDHYRGQPGAQVSYSRHLVSTREQTEQEREVS